MYIYIHHQRHLFISWLQASRAFTKFVMIRGTKSKKPPSLTWCSDVFCQLHKFHEALWNFADFDVTFMASHTSHISHRGRGILEGHRMSPVCPCSPRPY